MRKALTQPIFRIKPDHLAEGVNDAECKNADDQAVEARIGQQRLLQLLKRMAAINATSVRKIIMRSKNTPGDVRRRDTGERLSSPERVFANCPVSGLFPRAPGNMPRVVSAPAAGP